MMNITPQTRAWRFGKIIGAGLLMTLSLAGCGDDYLRPQGDGISVVMLDTHTLPATLEPKTTTHFEAVALNSDSLGKSELTASLAHENTVKPSSMIAASMKASHQTAMTVNHPPHKHGSLSALTTRTMREKNAS